MKESLEKLIGLSNAELFALSEQELEVYLAEALRVELPSSSPSTSPNRISLGSSRPSAKKFMGPSALAQQILAQEIAKEDDAELALELERIKSELKNTVRSRV